MRLVLSRDPRVRVVGEAGDGEAAWRLTCEHRPDVLVLDLGLPVIDGLDLIARLAAEDLPTRVVVVTARQDGAAVRAALSRGAHGYLLKTDDANALHQAVLTVAGGGGYVSRELADVAPGEGAGATLLTAREREIAARVGRGLSSKQIGAELAISEHTVRKHRENIARKLGLRNAAELVAWAIRHQP
jgi:DNA-binding NarL/FixJ family response regulator